MTLVAKQDKFTCKDYSQLHERPKIELIKGEFLVSPSPRVDHQEVSIQLGSILFGYVKKHGLGKVFEAPMDVCFSQYTMVQPDILFISKNRLDIINTKNIKGAPDLVIEILSPQKPERDLEMKKSIYEHYHVKEYWIVDPRQKTVTAMDLQNGKFELRGTYSMTQKIKSSVLPRFTLKVKDIFA